MRAAAAELVSFMDANTTCPPFRYLLTITPKTGSVVRWTDHERDITYGGNTFLAGGEGTTNPAVDVGDLDYGHGTSLQDRLPVLLNCHGAALFNGVQLPLFAKRRGFDGARAKVEILFFPPSGLIANMGMWWWEGPIAKVVPTSVAVAFDIEGPVSLLAAPTCLIPTNVIQPGCRNMLYDARCTLVKASFTQTFTVKSSPAPTVNGFSFDTGTGGTDPGRVAGYYRLGVAKFTGNVTAALANVEVGVRDYGWATNVGAVTCQEPLPVAPASGDTFTIYPGCAKTLAVCTNNDITIGPQFNNKVHFRGEPFLPRGEAGT